MNKLNETLFNIIKNQELIIGNQAELLRAVKGGKCISIDVVKSSFWEDKSEGKELEACDMTNLDEMDNEEDTCNCGFELEKGKVGCGKVIDEIVYRDDDGNITDTRWVHCGEDKELCDECREKQDAIGGNSK